MVKSESTNPELEAAEKAELSTESAAFSLSGAIPNLDRGISASRPELDSDAAQIHQLRDGTGQATAIRLDSSARSRPAELATGESHATHRSALATPNQHTTSISQCNESWRWGGPLHHGQAPAATILQQQPENSDSSQNLEQQIAELRAQQAVLEGKIARLQDGNNNT
jgi:hypothetical protein